MECIEKIIKKDMIDPTNGKKMTDKDIIPLQRVCSCLFDSLCSCSVKHKTLFNYLHANSNTTSRNFSPYLSADVYDTASVCLCHEYLRHRRHFGESINVSDVCQDYSRLFKFVSGICLPI